MELLSLLGIRLSDGTFKTVPVLFDNHTLPGHKYLYRPKFSLIFLRIYLLIIEKNTNEVSMM